MKRILMMAVILCSSILFLQSCSPKSTAGSTSLRRANVVGYWVLNEVSFEGVPAENVKSMFDDASYKCFIGSTWNLTNSGNGSYTFAGSADCPTKTQDIFWSVSTADETFQFKKLNSGEKAKNITDGYRLILSSASKDHMVLRSPVDYGNKPAYIVMTFIKNVK